MYIIVFLSPTFTTSISVTPGYGYIDVPQLPLVYPGDLLGHIASPPVLAKIPVDSAHADLACAGKTSSDSIASTDCVSTVSDSIQLRGIYTEYSRAYVELEFTSPGNFTVQVIGVYS